MSKTKNYAELSVSELTNELAELQKESFSLKMQKATGVSVKTHLINGIRRNIARIKTVLATKGVRV